MKNRSNEEIIVLVLCIISMLGLLPFAILRFSRGDFLVAAVDAIGFVAASLGFFYVYRTRSIHYAGVLLAGVALCGMVVNVFMLGPADIYFLYPVIIATFFLASSRLALGLTLSALVAVSIALIQYVDWFDFVKLFLSLLACILFALVFANQRNRQRDTLLQLSSEDPLTGAGNRRALHKRMEQLIASHKRTGEPMASILLDLDNFKNVNDQFGHITGDAVLQRVAATVTDRIRATDNLYRYGGDEFIILAISSTEETACTLADDIRQLVEQELAVFEGSITVSIGVAEYRQEETAIQWLERADKAMYGAKDAGKNSVGVQ
jgi:diguanylate cyclase (GGDEF)-like protein